MSMSTSKLRLGPLPKTETVKITIALTTVRISRKVTGRFA